MNTEVCDAKRQEEAGTQLGGRIIREGGLVAFPTETVYGLGANGLDGTAVSRIFEVKGRPNDNPLILHVAGKGEVRQLWDRVPDTARQLMDAFWPGPLTLIYQKSALVPDEVTAGLPTVAVRMPANKTARALIKAAGVPIAAPSANKSGRPSPTTAQHVLDDMAGEIPLIIDGGPCRYGLESTVLSVGKNGCTILRPGVVTQHMLEAVIGSVSLAPSILAPLAAGETVASPGMKYKHYAPKAQVIVVTGQPQNIARRINLLYEKAERAGKNCAILATKQTQHFYRGKEYAIIGDRSAPLTLCAGLFAYLRELGDEADILFAEGMEAADEGLAFMNRLLRAAGFLQENSDDSTSKITF